MAVQPQSDHWRKDGATAAPDELPDDFLCVFNFGEDSRTVKVFGREAVRGCGVILPTMVVSLTPEKAEVVRLILRRALHDVAEVAAGVVFVT